MPSREQIRALMDRFPDVDHMMAETLLIQHEKGRLDPAWEPQPRAEVTPGSMMVAQKISDLPSLKCEASSADLSSSTAA